MGVYINMEMPKSCLNCFLSRSGCRAVLKRMRAMEAGTWIPANYRHDDCPLVPVPPHGRLIDADALMHEFEKAQRTMAQHGREYSCSFMSSSQEISTEWYCVEDMLENAPTIIPAEEECAWLN